MIEEMRARGREKEQRGAAEKKINGNLRGEKVKNKKKKST